ncbi:hypothetical protein FACS1894159_02800 [Bacteroidia bacterium]|nr:hypothetical protein FACS1894159_02800 [Bacteroidia bacterium]
MKRFLLILPPVMAVATPLWGQFSIGINKPLEVTEYVADSVRKVEARDFQYISRAKEQAERRRLRNLHNTVEFNATLQAAQTRFDNWSAGGQNTLSARSTVFFRHQYVHNSISLDTKFEQRYGMNIIDNKPFKNEDEFKFNLMALFNVHSYWSAATSINLRSQLANGYAGRNDHTKKSAFMSPGYIDASLGVNYSRYKWLSITLSPFGWSLTTVRDPGLSAQGLFGVPAGDRHKGNNGSSMRVEMDKEFMNKVLRYRSSFYSFCDYKTPPNARWENTLDIRATKYLTTTIFGVLYYNTKSSAPHPSHVQFNSSISVGLSYKFKNK